MQKKRNFRTIINTNATQLNAKKSKELIEAGLDLIIYSFDGGSKKLMRRIDLEGLKNTLKKSIKISKLESCKNELKTLFPLQKYKCYSQRRLLKKKIISLVCLMIM